PNKLGDTHENCLRNATPVTQLLGAISNRWSPIVSCRKAARRGFGRRGDDPSLAGRCLLLLGTTKQIARFTKRKDGRLALRKNLRHSTWRRGRLYIRDSR